MERRLCLPDVRLSLGKIASAGKEISKVISFSGKAAGLEDRAASPPSKHARALFACPEQERELRTGAELGLQMHRAACFTDQPFDDG